LFSSLPQQLKYPHKTME